MSYEKQPNPYAPPSQPDSAGGIPQQQVPQQYGHGPQPYGHGPQPYGQGPQQQGQWVFVPPSRSTNAFAITSMVLGITWVLYLGSILALVFGYIALNQIKKNPHQGGRGMAIAGIVLGWVGVSFLALFMTLGIAESM